MSQPAAPAPAATVRQRSYRLAERILQPLARASARHRWLHQERLRLDRGVLVVVNHISLYDFLVIADFVNAAGRPVRFLAKESVLRLPVAGRLLTDAGQIPVRRASREAKDSLAAAIDAVNAGECVVVYPEGTLTRDPDGWPMRGKTGAARIALATGAPVIPVAQWGAQAVLPLGGRFPRLVPRRTVSVCVGHPIDLSRFTRPAPIADQPVDVTTLRAMTEAIMAELTTMVGQLRGLTPPVGRYDPAVGRRV
jgi:1-acyl-sn-glycerol-3-phosphate acyltransferase